jgi:hypothetical protein
MLFSGLFSFSAFHGDPVIYALSLSILVSGKEKRDSLESTTRYRLEQRQNISHAQASIYQKDDSEWTNLGHITFTPGLICVQSTLRMITRIVVECHFEGIPIDSDSRGATNGVSSRSRVASTALNKRLRTSIYTAMKVAINN